MSKFRLIKKYPGCKVDLNDIVELPVNSSYYNQFISSTITRFGLGIQKDLVEDNPEFWEEVIEKDYEILSFVNNGATGGEKGFIVPLQDDGYYYAKGYMEPDGFPESCSLKFDLECEYLDIHSIIRLSDGEIFTIGDVVTNRFGNLKEVIKGFEFVHGGDKLSALYISDKSTNRVYDYINCLRHVKISLLTTEDGVDIFEGDFICLVSKKYKIYDEKPVIKGCHYTSKIFSTKEAALIYVKENKLMYSEKDLKEFGIECFKKRSISNLHESEKVASRVLKKFINDRN